MIPDDYDICISLDLDEVMIDGWKKEILKIKDKIEISGYTVVPLKIYFQGPYAKVLIGIAKGKKNYDKKEVIKQRDLEREMKKMIK